MSVFGSGGFTSGASVLGGDPTPVVNQIIAGTDISISPTGGVGTVTISSTAGGSGVTQITAGTDITISPTGGTGNVTIQLDADISSTINNSASSSNSIGGVSFTGNGAINNAGATGSIGGVTLAGNNITTTGTINNNGATGTIGGVTLAGNNISLSGTINNAGATGTIGNVALSGGTISSGVTGTASSTLGYVELEHGGLIKLGNQATPNQVRTILPRPLSKVFTLINAGAGGVNTGIVNSGGRANVMANAFQFASNSFDDGSLLSSYNLLQIRIYGDQPLYGVANQSFQWVYSGGTAGVIIFYIVDTGNLSVDMPCHKYFQTYGLGTGGGNLIYPEIGGKDMTFLMCPQANSGFQLKVLFEQGAGGIFNFGSSPTNMYAEVTAVI